MCTGSPLASIAVAMTAGVVDQTIPVGLLTSSLGCRRVRIVGASLLHTGSALPPPWSLGIGIQGHNQIHKIPWAPPTEGTRYPIDISGITPDARISLTSDMEPSSALTSTFLLILWLMEAP